MTYQDIVLERDEGVGIIRLNRPNVLNALSKNLYQEVDSAISELEEEDQIKVVVFTGTGERAFSAGADIHEQVKPFGIKELTARVNVVLRRSVCVP